MLFLQSLLHYCPSILNRAKVRGIGGPLQHLKVGILYYPLSLFCCMNGSSILLKGKGTSLPCKYFPYCWQQLLYQKCTILCCSATLSFPYTFLILLPSSPRHKEQGSYTIVGQPCICMNHLFLLGQACHRLVSRLTPDFTLFSCAAIPKYPVLTISKHYLLPVLLLI